MLLEQEPLVRQGFETSHPRNGRPSAARDVTLTGREGYPTEACVEMQ